MVFDSGSAGKRCDYGSVTKSQRAAKIEERKKEEEVEILKFLNQQVLRQNDIVTHPVFSGFGVK